MEIQVTEQDWKNGPVYYNIWAIQRTYSDYLI